MKKFFVLLFLFFFQILFSDVEELIPQIIAIYPHDPTSFTQGLVVKDGFLYESSGLYEKSTLKKIDLQTGYIVKQIHLPPKYFAEGIAIIDNLLFQISWQEKTAFVYDLNLKLVKTLPYEGEGWGLCTDSNSLWKTDGSSYIYLYSQHFEPLQKLQVTWKGERVDRLNDLIQVENDFYINVWAKDYILRVNKNGKVTGLIDASHLLHEDQRKKLGPDGVLNGIAYNEKSKTFFITGKYWPLLFEVIFVPKKK